MHIKLQREYSLLLPPYLSLSLFAYLPRHSQQLISNISQRLSYTTCQSNPSSRAIIKHSTFPPPLLPLVLLPHTANIFSATLAFLNVFICTQYVAHEFASPQVESEMWNVESGEPYSSVLLRSTG